MRDPQTKAAELSRRHGLESASQFAWSRMNDHERGSASWQFWSTVVSLLSYRRKVGGGKPNTRAQKRQLRAARIEARTTH
jgi:hypothetical protein